MAKFNTLLFAAVQFITAVLTEDSCGVVPLEHWSGESSRRNETLRTPVDIVVVQHTVSSPCHTDSFCEDTVRSIRDYHIKRDYDDIGMSFLISGHGNVYEGAGWTHVGAHTRGYNAKAIAISFIGDFKNLLPSPEALRAVQRLLECAVKNNYLSEEYCLVGHRQLSDTRSPGDRLQYHIKRHGLTGPTCSENIVNHIKMYVKCKS